MTSLDLTKTQGQDAKTATESPENQNTRKRQTDLGPELLPHLAHFVALARKVKRPQLIQTLIERASGASLPEIAALMPGTHGALSPASRQALFQAVAPLSGPVLHDLEHAAERILLLEDEYGTQAVQSLLGHDDAAVLAASCDRTSRALYLYLRQEHPDSGFKIDRRFEQAERLQLMHRQWKSERYSSHYLGPKGIVPKLDEASMEALRDRIVGLYPRVSRDDIVIERFMRRDLAHADRGPDPLADAAAPVMVHTVTVTFNGGETHYKKVEHGEVVSHDDLAALSIVFSWEPATGALSVFSEDKQARAALAGLFRDVLLATDGEMGKLPLRQFDLSAFAHPTMVQRLAAERVAGVDTIALVHLKLARPFWHRTVVEAGEGPQTMQHLASHLVVMRDRRDTRNLYTVAYEDYALHDLGGFVPTQVKLVFRMAARPHRQAHNVTVQIRAPNGLNDRSKTADDRKRVMAQLSRLGIVREF